MISPDATTTSATQSTSTAVQVRATSTVPSTPMAQPFDQSRITLVDLPPITPPNPPIDDHDWITRTTRFPVLAIQYPSQGPLAMTWTDQLLNKDNVHLRGNCYVTANTIYKKDPFPNYLAACQTSTNFRADHGTRIDYFVVRGDNGIHLLTFTKKYSAGFDMDRYGATLDHVLNIID